MADDDRTRLWDGRTIDPAACEQVFGFDPTKDGSPTVDPSRLRHLPAEKVSWGTDDPFDIDPSGHECDEYCGPTPFDAT